jgi:hypothetical protein
VQSRRVTVVEFENLLITSRVHELADADLIFVLFVLLSEDDGVMLASRSDRLRKLSRSVLRETARRWFPPEPLSDALQRFQH